MSALGHSRHTNTANCFVGVRFTPKAGKWIELSVSLLCAKSGSMHRSYGADADVL